MMDRIIGWGLWAVIALVVLFSLAMLCLGAVGRALSWLIKGREDREHDEL